MASTNVLRLNTGCLVWKDHLFHSERGYYRSEFLHLEHYTLDGADWECTYLLACESYPSGSRDLMARYDILEELDPLTFREM